MAVGDNSPLGKVFTKELESPRRNGQYDQNSFGRKITLCNEMINQAGVIFAQFLHQFISSLPLSRCKNGKFLLRSTKFPLVCPSSSILNHKNYFLVLLTTIYERKNNTRDPLLDEGQTKLYWLYRSTAIFTFAQPDKKLKHHQRCCLAQFLSCIFVAQHS